MTRRLVTRAVPFVLSRAGRTASAWIGGDAPPASQAVADHVAHVIRHAWQGALTGGVAGAAVGVVLGHGFLVGLATGATIGGVGNAAIALVGLDV